MGRLAPDVVFYNGTIYTQDEARPKVEAVAVLHGRVVATGSSADSPSRPTAPTGHFVSAWIR